MNDSSASNSWRAHSSFPAASSSAADEVAQLAEHFDVERGVLQPRVGKGTGGPVGGGMLLGHGLAEIVLDERRQADPRQVEQSAGEFGVEQGVWAQPDLGEADEVLRCRMQDPLSRADGVLQLTEPSVEGQSDRSGRCLRRRVGPGSGRRVVSTGSPTRARRRWPPDRIRRRPHDSTPRRASAVSMTAGRTSRSSSKGAGSGTGSWAGAFAVPRAKSARAVLPLVLASSFASFNCRATAYVEAG